uniref:N-acetyltransferase n=1 Tax=Thermosporothrix sp. COM3 TaxID=2490863 RepID=A0A455SEQ1_9CHLR|nr:N-acetyltransferase [Thermosporothrix sp. COM3]
METYQLQRLTPDFLPRLIALSERVDWNYSERTVRTAFRDGPIYGHTTPQGELLSSAAIFPYGQTLAWLGMVIVHPDHQRRGLGRAVVQQCIDQVQSPQRAIKLIATAEGALLYSRLGFQTVGINRKFLCDSSIASPEPTGRYQVQPLRQSDLATVVALDEAAIGAERSAFLAAHITYAQQAVLLRDSSGIAVGYALSVPATGMLVIGPVVAPDTEAALLMVHELCKTHRGTLRIDVPQPLEPFCRGLARHGFQLADEPPIMAYNAAALPEPSRTLFAIASQAYG